MRVTMYRLDGSQMMIHYPRVPGTHVQYIYVCPT